MSNRREASQREASQREASQREASQRADPATGSTSMGPRFGIGGLLLITVVFAVMGGATRQFILATQRGSSPRAVFVIFTLAAPMIVVAVISSIHRLMSWLDRRQ